MQNHQEQNSNFKKDSVIIIALFIGTPLLEDEYQIDELERLVNTLGGTVIDKVIQYRKKIDPKFYIGKGKLKIIYDYAIEQKCKYVVINNDISASQIKNIQSYFKDKIMIKDRTGIIFDIFNKHAKTKESKSQIKLAQLEYLLPRLTRQWTHLERQMGGVGTRGGPGETQIEIDRRLVRNQILKLKKELIKISNNRLIQKKNRDTVFKVSLVGYTNAGKSTIMRIISNKNTYVKDELFATLDTSTRRINIDKNNVFILSDTVGFIRNIPDNLIASFRSTLGELSDSNLLLKVLDVTSVEFKMHLESIDSVLNHLNISDKNYLIVFNKIDQIKDDYLIERLKKIYPNCLFISAHMNINIDMLIQAIKNKMNRNNIYKTIHVPYSNGKLINQIYKDCEIIRKNEKDSHIEFKVSAKKTSIDNILEQIKK
jgi:GTP-binding protein HflX